MLTCLPFLEGVLFPFVCGSGPGRSHGSHRPVASKNLLGRPRWRGVNATLQPITSPRPLHHFHRTLGNRVEKRPAIGFRKDAVVEDDDDALIVVPADEAADALAEFEDGFGQ